jgi:hypothetical protein
VILPYSVIWLCSVLDGYAADSVAIPDEGYLEKWRCPRKAKIAFSLRDLKNPEDGIFQGPLSGNALLLTFPAAQGRAAMFNARDHRLPRKRTCECQEITETFGERKVDRRDRVPP